MSKIFPRPITSLPKADIKIDGLTAYLSQSNTHQILFMEFDKDAILPKHSHNAQYGIVLEGRIDLYIEDKMYTFKKGDRYFIPKGAVHHGKIYSGYADITFFDEKDRY